MSLARAAFCVMLFLAFVALPGFAQQTVKEPSTEKSFPVTVTYTSGGTDYTMTVTGLTVRKKMFFKVYGIAHYQQDPVKGKLEDVIHAILTDGKAKQITMDFARDVDAEKIKGAYQDGFKENATAEEMKTLQPLVDQFTGYFTKEVKENQQFILRWLPGGVIVASVAGEEKSLITSPLFAKVLWSIWFGEKSIVDREDLVEKLTN